MHDEIIIKAIGASATQNTGASLAGTLYDMPVTIALTGELGAGKTTFLQGFAQALDVKEHLTSPTYALEQRYTSSRGEFLHIDLYRTDGQQSHDLLLASEHHTGIRCIEWPERVGLEHLKKSGHVIHIDITEGKDGSERIIRTQFHDTTIPDDTQIDRWRNDARTPSHVVAHCDAVAALCDTLCDALTMRGQIIRKQAVHEAARLHDLLRFLDFRTGGRPDYTPGSEDLQHWEQFRERFPGLHHEAAAAQFARDEGFPMIAAIVAVHGLHSRSLQKTVEEKILYYADKRLINDRLVTLEERFADFTQRYGNGIVTDENRAWHEDALRIEQELFPDGVPA